MRRLFAALMSLALILNLSTTPAWAWGRTGRRVIAKLAEQHLSEKAKAEINGLLEPGESLADASTWADEVRGRMRETAPWHYIDCPLDAPRYDDKYAEDTPEKGYLVPKIFQVPNCPIGAHGTVWLSKVQSLHHLTKLFLEAEVGRVHERRAEPHTDEV